MANIGNTTVYTTVEEELLLIGTDELGRTRTTNGGGGGATTLAHYYRANINQENGELCVPHIFRGETLPQGVTITYNYTVAGLGGYYTAVRIQGWDRNKLFIPLFRNSYLAGIDIDTSMYRIEKGLFYPGLPENEVIVVFGHSLEDFQVMENMPFEIYFYN